MDLQPPSVLAQLPRPLHAATGKIHIGDVYSLTDSKKRKRYEVAVAVDGEAVNIYNVQTPKLVTSYAVPPQSSFSCRPCSVRRKPSNKSPMKRQTYVAVHLPEPQIKCFIEETGGNGGSAPVISSCSFSVKDSRSATVFMGIVPTVSAKDEDTKDPFDILTVHKDGRVRRLAPDLETQRWSIRHSEIAKVDSSHEVHSCFLVEFEDVRKSLFKRRQDLAALAAGDFTNAGNGEPSVLLLVSHPVGTEQIALKDVKVQIFSVPARAQSDGLALDESQKLRHLLTISIPDLDGERTFEGDGMQWNFHAGSAGLSLSFKQGFVNFDLSQYSPAITSQFILENEQFSSIMRISPQTVIGAGKSIVALYDTQYQSIQRSIAVDDVLSSGPSGTDNHKAPTTFLGYFAKLGIAVATKGNALLAFDLSSLNATSGSSLKRQRDGLLIDAIGRGIGSSAAQWDTASKRHRTEHMAALGLTSSEQVDKWNQLAQDLEKATASKDANAFDNAVVAYFSSSSNEPNTLPSAGQYVNTESTLFLLSKIFSLKDSNNNKDTVSSSSQLSLIFWPETTCNWLIELGHLSMENVEIALRRSFKPRILPPFPAGSFSQALINADPSCQHLIQILQGPVLMNAPELAYTLKLFLNMARSRSATLEETARAITNGDNTNNNTNKEHSPAETEQEGEPTLKSIFTGLNLTLEKIHSHPVLSIITALRSTLSRPETFSMLHHLRLSLATGGYTSRFSENPPTPISIDQITPPLSLNTIVDLLTASVDAIGPSGWISATASPTGTEGTDMRTDADAVAVTRELDLIGDMKSEVSAALAGVEEATYLKGVLSEYLRYADKVVSSSSNNNDTGKDDVGVEGEGYSGNGDSTNALVETSTTTPTTIQHEKLNGADLIVFAPPEGDEGCYYEGDASGKMLPLSLKPAASDLSRTKVKKSTGEVKTRSSREIGYLRRKAVGKYSFERLIV